MNVKIKAYGKLNLTLNVLGAFDERHHSLSSAATTVNVFDEVTLVARNDGEVSVTVEGNSFGGKTALEVAKAVVNKYRLQGVDINIVKGVPLCAGMGGSSAAAAGVLVGIAALYGLPLDEGMQKIAAKYGSDIAYLMKGGLALLEGKGEDITYYDCPKTLYFTVIEGAPLFTADVFAAYDKMPDLTFYDDKALLKLLMNGKIKEAGHFLGNNLQAAAVRLNPRLADIINICAKKGLPTPVMTGSGGNFFILCQNEEQAKQYAQTLKEEGLNAYPLNSVPCAIEMY